MRLLYLVKPGGYLQYGAVDRRHTTPIVLRVQYAAAKVVDNYPDRARTSDPTACHGLTWDVQAMEWRRWLPLTMLTTLAIGHRTRPDTDEPRTGFTLERQTAVMQIRTHHTHSYMSSRPIQCLPGTQARSGPCRLPSALSCGYAKEIHGPSLPESEPEGRAGVSQTSGQGYAASLAMLVADFQDLAVCMDTCMDRMGMSNIHIPASASGSGPAVIDCGIQAPG